MALDQPQQYYDCDDECSVCDCESDRTEPLISCDCGLTIYNETSKTKTDANTSHAGMYKAYKSVEEFEKCGEIHNRIKCTEPLERFKTAACDLVDDKDEDAEDNEDEINQESFPDPSSISGLIPISNVAGDCDAGCLNLDSLRIGVVDKVSANVASSKAFFIDLQSDKANQRAVSLQEAFIKFKQHKRVNLLSL